MYGRRLEEHSAELVEHFSYSSDSEDFAKVVQNGEMAAERSMSVYAYGEAARCPRASYIGLEIPQGAGQSRRPPKAFVRTCRSLQATPLTPGRPLCCDERTVWLLAGQTVTSGEAGGPAEGQLRNHFLSEHTTG